MTKATKERVTALLAQAGITVNGPKPTDIRVYKEAFYDDVFARGRLGIGEAFMRRDWDVRDLPGATALILRSGVDKSVRSAGTIMYFLQAQLTNMQKKSRALNVARVHYNAGNDLFERMLGPTMTYSCGYWKPGIKTLEEAQDAKHDLVCRRLKLKQGDHVLDIGCGWGGFLEYAAKYYGVTGIGIANSEEQVHFARERLRGLRIEIRLQDWRDVNGAFDRIASIGMFEHVGRKNYVAFFQKVRSLLRNDDSLALLHFIVSSESRWIADPWFEKYIFPGGFAPSLSQVFSAMSHVPQESCFPQHVHNFGRDYAPTLNVWNRNLSRRWSEIEDTYGPTDGAFFRMMRYYLGTMEGAFWVDRMQLVHIVVPKYFPHFAKNLLSYEPVY